MFYFHKLLSPDDILPAPESLLSSHSNNTDSTFSKIRVPVECITTHYSILLSLPSPVIYILSVTVTISHFFTGTTDTLLQPRKTSSNILPLGNTKNELLLQASTFFINRCVTNWSFTFIN